MKDFYTRDKTRSRSKSKFALPKTIRGFRFKQLTCASTCPWVRTKPGFCGFCRTIWKNLNGLAKL